MNKVLRLKGKYEQKKNSSRPGAPELPAKGKVAADKLEMLASELIQVIEFWSVNTVLHQNVIVSAYYRMVVAKSNRIKGLLVENSKDPNEFVVGAKFTDNETAPKHIITYCVSQHSLKESVRRLQLCAQLINKYFEGCVDKDKLSQVTKGTFSLETDDISKTNFAKVIVDAYYVQKFDIDNSASKIEDAAIVSIYDIEEDSHDLLRRLGIDIGNMNFLTNDTFYATPDQFNLLREKAPYLIAMSVSDLSGYSIPEDELAEQGRKITIPIPTNEPVIGVIDTVFDADVYFSNWVENHTLVSDDIPGENSAHGTEVSSIIVDGPSFNPDLDDGCGRFRVRHFGVTRGGVTSSFTVLKAIREIVTSNTDIKVWNLSLGSMKEINRNFISPEASILDDLQNEYDVIFVIAGTNRGTGNPNSERIGAPADSINSLVVNAVDHEGKVPGYSRRGPVLSFFAKPDICYFGGDATKAIRACTSLGEKFVTGTSFAAPWISRKLAFLINVMGFSRETAKALLIDSATGWDKVRGDTSYVGFGVVPIDIKDILESKNDEIRFVLSGTSLSYDTYNYNLPVPLSDNQFPFIARATLCYFPTCSRNQGVDYTNTELDLHFGRVKVQKDTQGIKTINNNQQSDLGTVELYEEDARKNFRKWDNVKHIGEIFTPNLRLRKKYDAPLWGLSMKTKERLRSGGSDNIDFGIVITLKNILGENRIQDFEQMCRLRGWLVNEIDVENQIQIRNQADTNIDWD